MSAAPRVGRADNATAADYSPPPMRALPLSILLALPALAACSERSVAPPGGSDAGPRRDATVTSSRADAAATDPEDAAVGPGDGGPGPSDGGPGPADSGTIPTGVPGTSLLTRLAGAWSGPCVNTLLGDFPRMVMDFRAADDRTLFARVDLDADNALRMAFFVETHEGADVVVFRNGGLFMGLSRDTRTRLVEVDEARGLYRFCAIQGGCAYNEATFTFSAPDRMVLAVTVRGQTHLRWSPSRLETRTTPAPFPAAGSVGTGTAPFPPLPSVAGTVRWSGALAADADVWIVLATQDCSFTSCIVSRHHLAHARTGDTQATLTLDQVHPGEYKVLAFLDRDRNVGTTLAPDSGDGVAAPNQALTVGPSGTTALSSTIVFDLP